MATVAMTACINDQEPKEWSLQKGDKCPDFQVTLNTGQTYNSTTPDNKTTIITFFNTNCKDCQRELPRLQQLYDQATNEAKISPNKAKKEQQPTVTIICISRAQKQPEIEAYWQENNLTLPYAPQPDKTIYNKFATTGIPRTYIISPTKTITKTYNPTTPLPTNLKDLLP